MTTPTSWTFGSHLDGFHDVGSQLLAHLRRRTERQLAAAHERNDRIASPVDVAERQAEIAELVLAGMGSLPPRQPGPPPYEEVGRIQRDGFVLHKLIIETVPGVFAPALLSIPDDLAGPTGAVLFSCGHSVNGKAAPLYQAACARFARNGLVTLVLDPIGQGERWSYVEPDGSVSVPCNTHEHSFAGVQCWWIGDSITRWFVHDARRAIDLLESLPQVDPARIAAVGNSGGGTLTTWLMALEPRIAAAVPSCFVTDRAAILDTGHAQDAEQHLLGDPERGIDHEDFLIAMAPRPVLVCSANHDFFPIDGTVRTVARARRIYDLLGAGDRLQHARVDERHGFTPGLAITATHFLVGLFLPGREVDLTDPEVLTDAEVQCTRTGQVRLDRPGAPTVFDLNRERHERRTDAAGQAGAQEWLAEQVHRPRRPSAELFPRWFAPTQEGDVVVRKACWSSEIDLLGCGVLVAPAGNSPVSVEIVLLDGGTADIDTHREALITTAAAGTGSLVVDVRGVGALQPHPVSPREVTEDYGTLFLVLTGLLWLGDSLAAGQVFDVLRAVELARTDPIIGLTDPTQVRLRGVGAGAFLARTAALLDPSLGAPLVEQETVVPHDILTRRLHGKDRDWLSVLPGLPHRATPAPAE